ncbi:MAG: hypothetical protein M1825_006184 [Sarcosagium campestre]|nr:MAG: hypothetical protein M1825_006184 [Sarcosagium campestre]
MSETAPREHGLAVTAVPTGLEFPAGRSSAESTIPSVAGSASSVQQDARLKSSLPDRPGLLKKSLTELPPKPRRKSNAKLQRRITAQPHALDNALWHSLMPSDSDSDSSVSSDDDAQGPPVKLLSKTGVRKTNSGLSAKGSRKSAGRKRGSDPGRYNKFAVGNDHFSSRGKVSRRDGRLNISVNETSNKGYLAKALGAAIKHHLGKDEDATAGQEYPEAETASRASTESVNFGPYDPKCPKLNIVIMVIGSRGDIQPFLRIGKVLKEQYGHRVRLATHPAFKSFVEKDAGLEFFSVGGDPAELMAFMVKNPGLIPSLATVRAGEIKKKREQMFEMFKGLWRACINATDDEKDIENLKMMGGKHPFVADAIIANPPCFAHIHCAERLGIPLHLIFTFPYSPTQAFPHPLANIKTSNVDTKYINFMSYPLVEMMTWQGLGDLVNLFRVETLGLDPVSTLWAPGQLYRFKVACTYLWSPGLVPKPSDWGPEIDIAGFVFLDLASTYKPPESLSKFLSEGPPPIYIGFGSIVVDDPDKFTSTILEAVKRTGVRALVSKGWGGLGGGEVPSNVYMLGNCPHDWLFPQVSAVIHHGGAGTTAIGLKCGKPTMIIPFFGDQPFWASMVSKAGAGYTGPLLPYKRLTVERLVEGIEECLSEKAEANAAKLAEGIVKEGDGAHNAVMSFHRSLPLRGEMSLRCAIFEDRVATWNICNTHLRLSALAAELLVLKKKITWKNLELWRPCEWNDFTGPGEPLTGGGAAVIKSVGSIARGLGGIPMRWAKSVKRHERKEARKRKKKATSSEGQVDTKVPIKGSEVSTATEARDFAKLGLKRQVESKQDAASKWADGKLENKAGSTDGQSLELDDVGDNVAQDFAADAGRGIEQSGKALARAPMEISLAIAQGFHNAPRLYGDTTVRRPKRITGMRSGMRAARDEFVYGVRDGVTGIVTQPYRGARDEGVVGFVKGTGKGVGGFVLKDLAALVGPVAYMAKGAHEHMKGTNQPNGFIRKARMLQGVKDMNSLTEAEKAAALDEVDKAWATYLEIRELLSLKDTQGVRGRLGLRNERELWQRHGAFENMTQARKGLDARKLGQDFDEVFRQQREELRRAQLPRRSTIADHKDQTHSQPKDQTHSQPKDQRRDSKETNGKPINATGKTLMRQNTN